MIRNILYHIILVKKMSQIYNKIILKPLKQTMYLAKRISKTNSNFIKQKDSKIINQRLN